jgi:hypothetical protein
MAARYVGTLTGSPTNYATRSFPVANGVTVTDGDFVYFASGRITSATVAGARLIGQVVENATGNAGGTVKALVNVEPNAIYLIDNDNVGTTFAASHVGTNFDLIGATGAQLVDTSTTGTTGSMVCLEYNPQIEPVANDTSWGLFMVAENAFFTTSGGQ